MLQLQPQTGNDASASFLLGENFPFKSRHRVWVMMTGDEKLDEYLVLSFIDHF